MFVCQMDVDSAKNLICGPFKTLRWLSVGLVLWGAIKRTNSPVGGASEFPCPPESVDQGI